MSAAAVRSKYDAETEQLDHSASRLHASLVALLTTRAQLAAYRNLYTGINGLPVEILRMIFEVYTSFDTDSAGAGILHPAMIISHTCALWRSISLNNPSMWTHVNLDSLSQRIASLVFERSEPCTLKTISYTKPLFPNILIPLRENMARVEGLDLHLTTEASIDFVSDLPDTPCLSLERIHLVGPDHKGRIISYSLVIDDALFDGHTPRLRHVHLERLRFPWSTGFYRNITSLKIENCPLGYSSDTDMHIASALRDCPLLETLHVSLTQRGTDFFADRFFRPILHVKDKDIVLERLREVTLYLPVQWVVDLFSAIDAPSVSLLDIHLHDIIGDLNDVPVLNLFKPGVLPPSVFSCVRALDVEAETWPEPIQIAGRTSDSKLAFSLLYRDMGDSFADLRSVGEAMTKEDWLPPLHQLTLTADYNHSSMFMALPSFMRMPATRMSLVGSGSLEALYRSHDPSPASNAQRWPELKELFVDSRLRSHHLKAFVQWCTRQPNLSVIDLSGIIIEATSTEEIVGFIRDMQASGLQISWDYCIFFNVSAPSGTPGQWISKVWPEGFPVPDCPDIQPDSDEESESRV